MRTRLFHAIVIVGSGLLTSGCEQQNLPTVTEAPTKTPSPAPAPIVTTPTPLVISTSTPSSLATTTSAPSVKPELATQPTTIEVKPKKKKIIPKPLPPRDDSPRIHIAKTPDFNDRFKLE
jgi:hypothetical protein